MNELIHEYLEEGGYGASARLARAANLPPPVVSKLYHKKLPVSFYMAVLLDKATGGKLRAEKLRPEDAELISYLRGTAPQPQSQEKNA